MGEFSKINKIIIEVGELQEKLIDKDTHIVLLCSERYKDELEKELKDYIEE